MAGLTDGPIVPKLDGLTIVLQYDQGSAHPGCHQGEWGRGGYHPNAKVFRNIPLEIPYKGELILGEAVISYGEFTRINKRCRRKNNIRIPRNLCSGSVRQLNNEITAKRGVHYFVFDSSWHRTWTFMILRKR
ncbi:MAG: hypothetical protein ACLTDS_11990 [Bianqueaceae bacterium]